ncbi:MAG: polysaccharide deacetylase family protein [Candidatus Omnitrophica bacterium]|nr:polysaccharide deacetylase family protein [Candidatus Omnitrophota bacterium]MDD5311067.1 polysaccharide deacetylase family protein [Candidatus Omnitrophota bacterium]MDD5546502.1 polysaccharide deacetylase family protein [Candidatus Omnitrophota bacterium]
MQKIKRYLGISAVLIIVAATAITLFCVFFDQAVFVRKSTVFRVKTDEKVVALTFDDGPSPAWTPLILDELKKAGIKATFFMVGKHVERYPEIAKRVAREGHDIENHGYDHRVMIYYKMDELKKEIDETEKIIKDVTGQTTRYFRPPKAWLNDTEKQKIKEMGYGIVLWSLNSKDWVTFHDKQITSYISRHIRPGDIILFHDSGGVFSTEGGDRRQTVKTIPRLVRKLQEKGYRFVTVSELLSGKF